MRHESSYVVHIYHAEYGCVCVCIENKWKMFDIIFLRDLFTQNDKFTYKKHKNVTNYLCI